MLSGISVIQVDVTGFDNQLSTVGHRVPRVHGQIHDDLLDLPWVSFHGTQRGIQSRAELDIFADETFEHLLDLDEHAVQIQASRLEYLLTAKCQQLARER